MSERWFVYITMAALAAVLYFVCEKFQILKSRPLRLLIVIFVSTVLCWGVCDFFMAAE